MELTTATRKARVHLGRADPSGLEPKRWARATQTVRSDRFSPCLANSDQDSGGQLIEDKASGTQ
jgi:hypothetical protein